MKLLNHKTKNNSKNKQNNENKEFELLKKQFVRKPENYLYYLGR